jgi:uncharacterized protein YggE
MRALAAAAVTSLFASGCSAAAAQTGAPLTAVPTINATGEGRREVQPDQATIVLGVETRAKTPAAAAAANADRMTAIRAALSRAGVADSNMSTARYSVHLQMGRTPSDTQYVAANMITVETRKLDEVGRLIDVGLGAGANNIGSLQYDLTDRSAVMREALADAVRDARRQAEVMAEAAGGRLGDLVDLGTQPGQYTPYFAAADVSMRMAAAAPTPISAGTVTVSATVVARWRFVPNR